jgi:sugar phosphate isomerase/epimerase
MTKKFHRRHFMVTAAAAVATSTLHSTQLWGKTIKHKPLVPVKPDILCGTTSSIWGGAGGGGKKTRETPWAIKRVAELGLQGIEFYGDGIEQYRGNPMELGKLMDASNVSFIGVSNGVKGQSTNFIDKAEIPKTMADHVAFCRDFLQPLGCDHWKINMGARPQGGPSDEQLKVLANTLNEMGRKTLEMGVRLSPHPHIWGPIEREGEMRRVMELTDPKYVYLTADTGHLVLGGGDAAQIISDYFPRVTEIHLKDTYAKYRGNKQTPTPEMHKQASVYHNLGGGGVDFQAVFDVLRKKHFKGWAIFDVDGPRVGDDGYDAIGGNRELAVDDYLSHNINYLRNMLGVKLPPHST